MRKPKIYLETSAISHLDAHDVPDKMADTLKLWNQIKAGMYEVYSSYLMMEEIGRCSEPKLTALLEYLNEITFNMPSESITIVTVWESEGAAPPTETPPTEAPTPPPETPPTETPAPPPETPAPPTETPAPPAEPEPIPILAAIALRNTADVAVGRTIRLEPFLTPFNVNRSEIIWSSSDVSVATVDSNGVVRGVSNGTARITASDISGEITDYTTVTVRRDQRAVQSITMNRNLALGVGDTHQMSVTLRPNNPTFRGVTWSSNNSAVARVDASGRVIAIAPGTATITATSDSGARVATSTVTVRIPVTSLTLDQTSITLSVGERHQIVPTISPTDATEQRVTYSSRNSSIAFVSTSGQVTARRVGSTTITVTVDGRTETLTVRVVR